MQFTRLGNSELSISKIIMGTWQAGKWMWTGIDDAESRKAIRAAYDAGITTFDTAAVYGRGHSERIVGEALAEVRTRVIIATKVFADQLRYDQVVEACHRSLRNLGTDYIDLYQIHWPAGTFGSPPVPIAETLGAMNKLKAQGKIRAIGVSNFNSRQLHEAIRYAAVESLQPPCSLFWRHAEAEARPVCAANGITVLAYSPMAQGLLTGRFGPDHRFEKGDHRAKNKLFKPQNYTRVQEALAQLRPIAHRKAITLGQLALAWVIARPDTCAIAGARRAEQVLENARAAEVALGADELEEMERIGSIVTAALEPSAVMWDF